MAGKKKGCPRKKAGRARVQQKDDKPQTWVPAGGDQSSSSGSKEIDTTKPLGPKKKKNLLLTLPLELRVKIYQLVLKTGSFDEENQSHVYEIGERRAQRSKNLALRSNNFTPMNIRNQHFALLKTCRAVRQEIHSFVNLRYSFSFASPLALAKFALRSRATYHASISKEVAETYGRHVLYRASAGKLRVLREAEGLVVLLNSDDAHIESVEQLMGLIVNSFRCAWRGQPLIPKGTGAGC